MLIRLATGAIAILVAATLWTNWRGVTSPSTMEDGEVSQTSHALGGGSAVAAPTPELSEEERLAKFEATEFAIRQGTVRIDFDRNAAETLGIRFFARGAVEEQSEGRSVTFSVDEHSTFSLSTGTSSFDPKAGGRLATKGALWVDRFGEREVIGNMALTLDNDGRYAVVDGLSDGGAEKRVFDVASVMVDLFPPTLELQMIGELTVTESWARDMDRLDWAGARVGILTVNAGVTPVIEGAGEATACNVNTSDTTAREGTIGPDVIVADLQSVRYYGQVNDIHAYAVGTYACNIGDERANWISHTNQHPMILQNMYRLKDDKFEQIGMAWIKHGFYAVSWNLCSQCNDPTNGTQLGVGCADPYSSSLNGAQNNMSKLSGEIGCEMEPPSLCEVNPYTGYFPYPWTPTEFNPTIGKRLQVHKEDLDPALNAGAQYFVEGHYITADDASAGNGENNASYRPVEVSEEDVNNYPISPVGSTVRTAAAVRAWQDQDPTVSETDIHVPGEGLFILAAKAIELNNGLYRYAYALENLNSARSARSFSVPLPDGAVVGNVLFHDVDYHSGEVYDGTDWAHVIEDGLITWYTTPYETDPLANALRYNTTYSFYFETNVAPSATNVRIGLFRPGNPEEVKGISVGPSIGMIDCNMNGVADECDLDCNAEGCEWPCGGSIDCNGNGAPDECEADCNENDIADTCDIAAETSLDCNQNTVPDECEPDCDENGIPDDCIPPADSDLDGVDDCSDLCPLSTPESACACPPDGECCWQDGFFCLDGYQPQHCLDLGGVPECIPAPCTQGCLMGDFDSDGDLDLRDYAAMQIGFGPTPVQDYSLVFDFDDDEDIDLKDYEEFTEWQSEPR